MSRQDFEALAETISFSREQFKSNTAHARFASSVADMCAEQNERFDRARFIMAAMPRAWVGTRHSNIWERIAREGQ